MKEKTQNPEKDQLNQKLAQLRRDWIDYFNCLFVQATEIKPAPHWYGYSLLGFRGVWKGEPLFDRGVADVLKLMPKVKVLFPGYGYDSVITEKELESFLNRSRELSRSRENAVVIVAASCAEISGREYPYEFGLTIALVDPTGETLRGARMLDMSLKCQSLNQPRLEIFGFPNGISADISRVPSKMEIGSLEEIRGSFAGRIFFNIENLFQPADFGMTEDGLILMSQNQHEASNHNPQRRSEVHNLVTDGGIFHPYIPGLR